MSFSSTALEQREKELKALTTFLTYSLIGSLTLHIGLLASGIGNLLMKVPEIAEEPLEITIVETPPEVEPQPLEKLEQPQPDIAKSSRILTSSDSQPSGGTGSLSINNSSSPSELKPQPQQNSVVATKVSPVVPFPKIEALKPLPAIPKETVTERKLEPQSPAKVTAPQNILSQTSSRDSTTVQASSQPSTNLSKLLTGIRDGKLNQGLLQPSQGESNGNSPGTSNLSGIPGNGSGSGNGQQNGSNDGNSPGTSNSSGIPGNGSGSGNAQENGSKVAAAPTTPKTPKIESKSGNGRAACRECDTSYPEWARKRGLEGRVEVAVDTDSQGNVTKVRLLRSSGNDKLDREHLERSRNWKLKPSAEGRQGVSIGTEYAIAGSQRHRQLAARKKQREAEARNSESTNTASNSVNETPKRRKRLITSISDKLPNESNTETRRVRRQRALATSSESTRSTSSSTNRRERLKEVLRARREQAATNNSSSSGQTRKSRRRREINPPSSVNSNSESNTKPTRRRRSLEQPTSSDANQQPSTN